MARRQNYCRSLPKLVLARSPIFSQSLNRGRRSHPFEPLPLVTNALHCCHRALFCLNTRHVARPSIPKPRFPNRSLKPMISNRARTSHYLNHMYLHRNADRPIIICTHENKFDYLNAIILPSTSNSINILLPLTINTSTFKFQNNRHNKGTVKKIL